MEINSLLFAPLRLTLMHYHSIIYGFSQWFAHAFHDEKCWGNYFSSKTFVKLSNFNFSNQELLQLTISSFVLYYRYQTKFWRWVKENFSISTKSLAKFNFHSSTVFKMIKLFNSTRHVVFFLEVYQLIHFLNVFFFVIKNVFLWFFGDKFSFTKIVIFKRRETTKS